MSQVGNNRPNRDWRIRGNTARAVIHRSQQPLEITMALESRPNGKQPLTLKAGPPLESNDDTNQTVVTTDRF